MNDNTLLRKLIDEDRSNIPFSKPKIDNTRTMRGAGKSQVLLLKNEIMGSLEAGYPILRIWACLYKAKQTTLSYEGFRKQVKKTTAQLKEKQEKQEKNTDQKENNLIDEEINLSTIDRPVSKSENVKKESLFEKYGKTNFSHNSIPDPDDLY